MYTYGGQEATIASETSEYGWISKYEQELEEREHEASLILFVMVPSAEESSAGEAVVVVPEAF